MEFNQLLKKLSFVIPVPFIIDDILLHILVNCNDYKICWYFPDGLSTTGRLLITKYFSNNTFIGDSELLSFPDFFDEAETVPSIKIRPEVRLKVEAVFEQKLLSDIADKTTPGYSGIHAE